MPLLAGGCDHVTKSWFQADVVNRPDGAILVWRHDSMRHHLRLSPVDPGATHIEESSLFHAWASRVGADGRLASSPVALDYRWTHDDDQMRQFPSYTLVRDRLIAHQCYQSSNIVAIRPTGVRCDPLGWRVYEQIGKRAEAIYRSQDALVFDAGLGGSSHACAVSLRPLGGEVLGAFRRTRHYADGPQADPEPRFAISWLPPRPAYLIDYAGEDLPIFEVTCGGLRRIGALLQIPALADLVRQERFRESIEVSDIVPTADPDNPALLLTWDEGEIPLNHVSAVVRPKSGLRRLPRRISEQLGLDRGVCRCGAFWAGNADRILIDVSSNDQGDQASIGFEIYDVAAGRMISLRTRYRLDPD